MLVKPIDATGGSLGMAPVSSRHQGPPVDWISSIHAARQWPKHCGGGLALLAAQAWIDGWIWWQLRHGAVAAGGHKCGELSIGYRRLGDLKSGQGYQAGGGFFWVEAV